MHLEQRVQDMQAAAQEAVARPNLRELRALASEIMYLQDWTLPDQALVSLQALGEQVAAAQATVRRRIALQVTDYIGALLRSARKGVAADGRVLNGGVSMARRRLNEARRLLGYLDGCSGADARHLEQLRERVVRIAVNLSALEEARQLAQLERGARLKYLSCDCKRAYKTREEAYSALQQRTYACPYCGQWHNAGFRRPRRRRRRT